MRKPSKVTRQRSSIGQTDDLFAPQLVVASPPMMLRSVAAKSCWLALNFPTLSAVSLPIDHAQAAVVVAAMQRDSAVLAVSVLAAQAGITVGMPLSTAELRVDALRVVVREAWREQQALVKRAEQAQRYTSWISLEPPTAVLLEVQGSLSLFGGLESLRDQLLAEFLAQGDCPQWAVAPTPKAALWLARACPSTVVESMDALRSVLADMPLWATHWPEAVLSTCQSLGVRTLGELRRLPRDGVQRRLGVPILHDLQEAYGERPSVRQRWVMPERFYARVDLSDPTSTTSGLLPVMQSLLQQLETFLEMRSAAVSSVKFRLAHRARLPTVLVLGRSLPAGRMVDWMPVLAERVANLVLSAPVESMVLRSSAWIAHRPESGQLTAHDPRGAALAAEAGLFLDRLRARLGDQAVQGLCWVAEHRPERAYRSVPVQHLLSTRAPIVSTRALSGLTARPLWLLRAPLLLMQVAGKPCYGGPLLLCEGAERIESGWWDGCGIARDYYRAHNPHGIRLWIFRARVSTGLQWFLHGFFA